MPALSSSVIFGIQQTSYPSFGDSSIGWRRSAVYWAGRREGVRQRGPADAGTPRHVIEFGEFQDHFAQLMREAKGHNLMLVDPRSTKNAGDPHVIALALFLEQRDLRDMPKVQRASARCLVVSHEAPRNPAAALARIPDVAAHYRLQHISLVDMLRAEGLQAEVARDSEGLLR